MSPAGALKPLLSGHTRAPRLRAPRRNTKNKRATTPPSLKALQTATPPPQKKASSGTVAPTPGGRQLYTATWRHSLHIAQELARSRMASRNQPFEQVLARWGRGSGAGGRQRHQLRSAIAAADLAEMELPDLLDRVRYEPSGGNPTTLCRSRWFSARSSKK